MSDDERIAEIRDIHVAGVGISAHVCANCYDEWPCDTVYLLARVDALAAERDESVGNMTAIAAAFARLKTRSESWNDDSKRLHNEYMPTVAIIDELLAIKDAAITKAEAERDAALARLEASEAALEQARRMLTYTLEAVVPEPCDCGDMEYCRECLAVKTIEQASAALAASSGAQEARDE